MARRKTLSLGHGGLFAEMASGSQDKLMDLLELTRVAALQALAAEQAAKNRKPQFPPETTN